MGAGPSGILTDLLEGVAGVVRCSLLVEVGVAAGLIEKQEGMVDCRQSNQVAGVAERAAPRLMMELGMG